jgi:GntR family transcriptional regulator, transcriptional repressor for pyruvate dehydrogenase complex
MTQGSMAKPVPKSSVLGSVPAKLRPPQSYGNKIADELLALIKSGSFEPGARLPTEQELSNHFGVARTVVREAISALRQQGWVESYQGRGLFVAEKPPPATFQIDDTDLENQVELNRIIEFLIPHEAAAAALAAERRTEDQLRRLRYALVDLEAASTSGESGIDADFTFHAVITEAADNPYFASFNSFLEDRVRHLIRTARTNSARVGLTGMAHREHHKIYEAIAAKDPDAARAAAEQHLRNAAARLFGDRQPAKKLPTAPRSKAARSNDRA